MCVVIEFLAQPGMRNPVREGLKWHAKQAQSCALGLLTHEDSIVNLKSLRLPETGQIECLMTLWIV